MFGSKAGVHRGAFRMVGFTPCVSCRAKERADVPVSADVSPAKKNELGPPRQNPIHLKHGCGRGSLLHCMPSYC